MMVRHDEALSEALFDAQAVCTPEVLSSWRAPDIAAPVPLQARSSTTRTTCTA